MKVYVISTGKPNTGYEWQIKCIVSSLKIAEFIQESFDNENLLITEFEMLTEE